MMFAKAKHLSNTFLSLPQALALQTGQIRQA